MEFRAFVVNIAVPLQVLYNQQSNTPIATKKEQYESVLNIIAERERRTLPQSVVDEQFTKFEVRGMWGTMLR